MMARVLAAVGGRERFNHYEIGQPNFEVMLKASLNLPRTQLFAPVVFWPEMNLQIPFTTGRLISKSAFNEILKKFVP